MLHSLLSFVLLYSLNTDTILNKFGKNVLYKLVKMFNLIYYVNINIFVFLCMYSEQCEK